MVLGPKNLNHMNEMNYFSTYSYCTELRKKKNPMISLASVLLL